MISHELKTFIEAGIDYSQSIRQMVLINVPYKALHCDHNIDLDELRAYLDTVCYYEVYSNNDLEFVTIKLL